MLKIIYDVYFRKHRNLVLSIEAFAEKKFQIDLLRNTTVLTITKNK